MKIDFGGLWNIEDFRIPFVDCVAFRLGLDGVSQDLFHLCKGMIHIHLPTVKLKILAVVEARESDGSSCVLFFSVA
jgi:hypothetical protein